MINPFVFVGSNSLKENFIGRSSHIETIVDHILNGGEMTSLVGLPRMGKTTLIWHLFLEENKAEWWLAKYRTIPIFADISKQPKAKNLWGAVATKLLFSLKQIENTLEDINTIMLHEGIEYLKTINNYDESADRHNILENILSVIASDINLKIIFIFDELDYLWKYNYSQDEFLQIRSLSSYGHVITASRRTPNHIERMAHESNYFDNKTKIVWISPFTSKEVELYWQHFCPYFADFSEEEFSKYKLLVSSYAGNHPNMMNIMNDAAFSSGNIVTWHQTMNQRDRKEAERKFRFSLEEAFQKQMSYLKEQELEKSAISLVLEGVELPKEKDIEYLENYGFIKRVPSSVKKSIFGYDMGPLTFDGKFRYICMSNFFSHLMKETYEPTVKGLQLLKTTERKMQYFVRELLKIQYGEDCLESEEDENSKEYKERWEQYFEPKECEKEIDEDTYLKEKKEWILRREIRYKRVINGCRPSTERPLIDTLSSFDIGSIIYIFFNKKRPWNNDALRFAKKWNHDFQKWRILRNSVQHFYVEEKTEEFINKAEESCHKMCKDIDQWMMLQHKYQK